MRIYLICPEFQELEDRILFISQSLAGTIEMAEKG